jgi:signal peptidase I
VQGTTAAFRNVRLYRDVHYTQAGRNAVRGKVVRLAADQYFVMGDNSPNSEDSRFWPDQGVLPRDNILGKAFAVHMPSRVIAASRWGRSWQCQIPDWQRVRWLR